MPDLSATICPPYDVISTDDRRRLAARDPRNAVHVELPEPPPGAEPDERYREAARRFVAWRTDGTLRKDPRAAIYVHEQLYRVPGRDEQRTTRGFFCRVGLEPFGPDGGVRPHERTHSGPKEDRLRLLRATGVNLSPVVLLYRGPDGRSSALLDALTHRLPDREATDDDGVTHRVWVVPLADEATEAHAVLDLAGSGPLTIADGHHRYETALRYRAERGRNRACESDPAYDYVLALLFDAAATPLTILPTHRVVRGDPSGQALLEAAGELFSLTPCPSRDALLAAVSGSDGDATGASGRGVVGVWTRDGGGVMEARHERFQPFLPPGSAALRGLDVTLLAVALERWYAISATETSAGDDRLRYTKDAKEATDLVDRGDADAAFILRPTPVEAVLDVAAAGEQMPPKSTYFYPKAATGLVFNPLES